MKHFINKLLVFLLVLSTLSSCIRLDFDQDNETPPIATRSKVNLTTNWTQRGAGISTPSAYTVIINNERLEYQQATNQLPEYSKGHYTAWVYNQIDRISVTDEGIASVETSNNEISTISDWFFTSSLAISYTDKAENYTAQMKQQVRELNINVTIIGDGTQTATELKAKLEGVANTINIKDHTLSGGGLFIKPIFAKEDNFFKSEIRLMGLTNETKMLTLDIRLADNSIKTVKTDLGSKLADFNIEKHIPMTLSIDCDLSTGIITIETSISDWVID